LETLRLRAREFDYLEQDESLKGMNFLIRNPSTQGDGSDGLGGDDLDADGGGAAENSIGSLVVDELRLLNVPLGAVLQYICDKTRLRFKLDDHAVILLPVESFEEDDLYPRNYTVPPDFISRLSQGSGSGGGQCENTVAG
jgi:hypothetical protein